MRFVTYLACATFVARAGANDTTPGNGTNNATGGNLTLPGDETNYPGQDPVIYVKTATGNGTNNATGGNLTLPGNNTNATGGNSTGNNIKDENDENDATGGGSGGPNKTATGNGTTTTTTTAGTVAGNGTTTTTTTAGTVAGNGATTTTTTAGTVAGNGTTTTTIIGQAQIKGKMHVACKHRDMVCPQTGPTTTPAASENANNTASPRQLTADADLENMADLLCSAFSFAASVATCEALGPKLLKDWYQDDLKNCATRIGLDYRKAVGTESWQTRDPQSSAGGCLMTDDKDPKKNGACFVNSKQDPLEGHPVTTACTKSIGTTADRNFKTKVTMSLPTSLQNKTIAFDEDTWKQTFESNGEGIRKVLKFAMILAAVEAATADETKQLVADGIYNVTQELGISIDTLAELGRSNYTISIDQMKTPKELPGIWKTASKDADVVLESSLGKDVLLETGESSLSVTLTSPAAGMMVVSSVVLAMLSLIF